MTSRDRRFYGWFTANELNALDAANSGELAVLLLEPSAFAVLGRLCELVYWDGLIVQDIDTREYEFLRSGIYMQMSYTHNLDDALAAIANNVAANTTAIEQVAANVQSSGNLMAQRVLELVETVEVTNDDHLDPLVQAVQTIAANGPAGGGEWSAEDIESVLAIGRAIVLVLGGA